MWWMPAGYRLTVGMYDTGNGQRLPVFTAEGADAGDSIGLQP